MCGRRLWEASQSCRNLEETASGSLGRGYSVVRKVGLGCSGSRYCGDQQDLGSGSPGPEWSPGIFAQDDGFLFSFFDVDDFFFFFKSLLNLLRYASGLCFGFLVMRHVVF